MYGLRTTRGNGPGPKLKNRGAMDPKIQKWAKAPTFQNFGFRGQFAPKSKNGQKPSNFKIVVFGARLPDMTWMCRVGSKGLWVAFEVP
jgi:hypothetical protein